MAITIDGRLHPGVRRPVLLGGLRRRLRLSPPGRVLARLVRSRITPGRLERHAERARTVADPSHAGEWAHLALLLGRLTPRELVAVDLAAGDGVTSSCTLPLYRDQGWRGLAVECDAARFRLLAHAYRAFPRVALSSQRVTPGNVVTLLREAGVPPEIGVLNLDLDSYDLAVAEAILTAYRPLVVDIEVNEKVPPPIRFAVRYTPGFRWDEGHCYGCSLSAAADVLGGAGYVLEGLAYNNAFFVRADAAAAARMVPLSPELAHRLGYRGRPDRAALFPWNADMEELLDLPAAGALLRLKRRFARARADFALQLEPLAPGWSGRTEP